MGVGQIVSNFNIFIILLFNIFIAHVKLIKSSHGHKRPNV